MKIRVPKLVKIEGGEFWMGSKPAPYESEEPYHQVTVKEFYLGIFPVTEEEYQDFMDAKNNDAIELEEDKDYNTNDCLPAHDINWIKAIDYCNWLTKVTGKTNRLPTEAEWEFAAKANKGLMYPTATGEIHYELANYSNYEGNVTSVKKYPPNPLGLHDMAGNVWEWCSSKKGDYSSSGVCTKPYDYPYNENDGREDIKKCGASRVLRGGCYSNKSIYCRSAARYREFESRSSNYHRSRGKNSFGFRVAVSA